MAKVTERSKSTTTPSHDEEWRHLRNYTGPDGEVDWEKYRKDRAGCVPDPVGIGEHVPSDWVDWRNYCSLQGWEVYKALTGMRHPHDLVTDTGESPEQIREEIVQMKKRYPKVMNSLLRDAEADGERVGGKNYARWRRIVDGLLMLALGLGMIHLNSAR